VSVKALVLAGTRQGGDPLARELGVAHKALIAIDGEPILARVVRALRRARIARIAVSCEDEEVARLARSLGAETIPAQSGPSASVKRGFDALGAPLLVTTSDHALLQADWIVRLIEGTPPSADLGVMMARRDKVEAAAPNTRRTYLRFADGEWSGCNLFLLKSPKARAALDLWSQIEADRKRPWRIARRLGLSTLLAYALGRLTIQQALDRLGARAGLAVAMVAASDGRAAIDIDKREDLELVEALLAKSS